MIRVRRLRWYHRLWDRVILMQLPNYHAFKHDLRSIWGGR